MYTISTFEDHINPSFLLYIVVKRHCETPSEAALKVPIARGGLDLIGDYVHDFTDPVFTAGVLNKPE